jgi:hypothetical protein
VLVIFGARGVVGWGFAVLVGEEDVDDAVVFGTEKLVDAVALLLVDAVALLLVDAVALLLVGAVALLLVGAILGTEKLALVYLFPSSGLAGVFVLAEEPAALLPLVSLLLVLFLSPSAPCDSEDLLSQFVCCGCCCACLAC